MTGHEGRHLYDFEQGTAPGDRDQPERDTIDEYICGASGEQPKKERWADWPSDEDDDWMKVARTWSSKSGTKDRRAACSSDEKVERRDQIFFGLSVFYPFLMTIRTALTRAFSVLRVTRVNG